MQEGNLPEINRLGIRLSLELHCPVRLASNGMNVLVCKHDVPFSISRLKIDKDWFWAKELHKEKTNDTA